MLSLSSIKNFAKKFQTNEINICREYFQHLFLSYFYQEELADRIFFKGGTALKFIYGSPRFSEDLDFTGLVSPYYLKNLLERIPKKLSSEDIAIKLEESKATTGGYLSIMETNIAGLDVRVELNISLRKGREKIIGESVLVTTPLVPSYTALILKENLLVREKINALLERSKARDYFDLYFILRKRLAVEELIAYQSKILQKMKNLEWRKLRGELKEFLPKSHWNILNNFDLVLKQEIEKL